MDEHDDVRQRLRRLGTQPIDPGQRAADLTAMARLPARPSAFGPKVRIAAAFLAGLLIGGSGLAAADVLPDPAQHVAHTVLDRVGVDVPDPERYHGPECGTEVKGNHGEYVRDDHGLAKSDCGKPVHASQGGQGKGAGDDQSDADEPDACRGKPPWAGDKTITAEEKAAAQAERAALCGPDVDDPAELDTDAGEVERDGAVTEDSTTTTTESPTTSTESTTTTEAPTTTTTTG